MSFEYNETCQLLSPGGGVLNCPGERGEERQNEEQMGLDIAVYIYAQCNVGILIRFDSMLSTLLIIICLRLFFVFK